MERSMSLSVIHLGSANHWTRQQQYQKKKKYNKYKIRNKAEKKIKKYNNHYSNELGTAAEVDVDVADDYNTMDEIMRAIM